LPPTGATGAPVSACVGHFSWFGNPAVIAAVLPRH
jgi:hypothetical protein